MIRVLIADDSATARMVLRAIIESDRALSVVAEARDGIEAVEMTAALQPDLVIMDVHMPGRDGLEATKEIMMIAPTPILIVSSARHYRDIEISLSATQAGALMMVAKPSGPASTRYQEESAELISLTKALSQVKVVRRWTRASEVPEATREPLREPPPGSFDIVTMAASTGGPAALRRILIDIPIDFAAPIVIVQHIARGFSAGFAQWLGASCALPVRLAADGEKLQRGRVYVAPDDLHLGFSPDGSLRLSDAAPVNRFRPSADHMFISAAAAYRDRSVAVICSGMGADGALGLADLHAAGSFVIAQDEATSVVFGMAQEAIKRNAVDLTLPVEKIGVRLIAMVGGARV